MKIILIAAMAKNRVIGLDNQMPWHLPADLQHFKRRTTNATVVMGRNTYESIGKPLPNRENWVVSRTSTPIEGVTVMNSLDAVWHTAEIEGLEKLIIMGGENLYKQTLSLANELWLTEIDADLTGDRHFPDFSALGFAESARRRCVKDAKNPFDYTFVDYKRVKK